VAGDTKSVRLAILGDNADAKAKIEQIDAMGEELATAFPELKLGIDTAVAAEKIKVFRTVLAQTKTEAEKPIELTADDVKAVATLDDLKAKVDALKAARATITIDADDKAAVAKIAALDASIEALSKRTADPKVTVDGVPKALADIAALDFQIDNLKRKTDTEDVESAGAGIIGRFLTGRNGSGGLSSGLTSVLGKLPLVGDGLTSILEKLGSSGASEGAAAAPDGVGLVGTLGSVTGSAGGLAVVAGVIGAVVTEATALATGFVAAGAGVGAFGALALPTLKTIFGAVGDTKAELAKLPEPIRLAVTELKNVKAQFDGMAKAFQIPTVQVFSQAIGILSDNLKYLAPLANAAQPAIIGVLAMLNKGLDSNRFKGFMDFITQLTGPAITAIGSGMAGLTNDLLQLFTVMSQKDVINGINIAFRLAGAALSTLLGIVEASMTVWDFLTAQVRATMKGFDEFRHAVATGGHDIAGAFDTARHGVATAAHDIAGAFDTARHGVATAGHDIAHAFDTVRHAVSTVGHDIVSGLTTAYNWISSHWKQIVAWLVDPIGMAVYTIRTHTHQIAQAFDQLRHDVSNDFALTRHAIAATVDAIGHDIKTGFDNARHWAATTFDNIRHDASTAFANTRHEIAAIVDGIPGDLVKVWNAIVSGVEKLGQNVEKLFVNAWHSLTSSSSQGASQVGGFFQKLPGQIIGFLERLPGDMLKIGENIVNGLLNGIKSAASGVLNYVKGLASDISSYFTNPLKIFSPSRVFMEHGENIVQGAVVGIQNAAPRLHATMRNLGVTTANAGLGNVKIATSMGAAAGAGASIKAEWVGGSGADQQFISWLKQNIRIRGGNPAVLGR